MSQLTTKTIARKLLGGALMFAGLSHLTFARKPFRAQVPDWVPLDRDDTVVYSGFVEIALGSAIAFVGRRHQKLVGRIAAAFFAGVFPGNLSQWWNRRSAFGLDTDNKRFARLFMQPLLIYWALKSMDEDQPPVESSRGARSVSSPAASRLRKRPAPPRRDSQPIRAGV